MYSEETQSNENTFWNWFLILGAVLIIWYVFFKNKEKFTSSTKSETDRKMKIIQKIDNVSKAMGDTQLNKDSTYPLLNQSKSQTTTDMNIQSKYDKLNNVDNTADGSTKWMNQIGFLDGEKVACNMLGVNSEAMDDYKKKFYSMYAHQIECPAKCGLKSNGMSKGCGMGTKCGLNPDCSNINTLNTIPDTFALNHLALDNANKKSCVTCNFKLNGNQLNRQWLDQDNPSYEGLTEDVRNADEARLNKLKIIDANASNYANFKNNVYQDSIGESAPDRINEIRTCQDAYGTCKLSDYGSTIGQAYDKLMANPAYTSRNNCDPYKLTGVLEDGASTDMYASL